jgi:sugar/nucleoside kinase (ribokinase family)
VTPEFVVAGHVVLDVVPGGWRLGGTAAFAAMQAHRLGLRTGVVTRAAPDLALGELLPDVRVAGRTADTTTSFENVYEGGRRRQRVPARAGPVEVDDVPLDWRAAPIALIGPVCGEAPAGLARCFTSALVGVSAQGWLRQLDDEGRVQRQAWTGAPFWDGARVLFVSDEDLGDDGDELARWTAEVPVVALTRAARGARMHSDGRWREIEAFPAREVDPTGAGDVFAAAFLARYHETDDIADATRFASAAAAWSVEHEGTRGVADRPAIEARLAQHPEITLR